MAKKKERVPVEKPIIEAINHIYRNYDYTAHSKKYNKDIYTKDIDTLNAKIKYHEDYKEYVKKNLEKIKNKNYVEGECLIYPMGYTPLMSQKIHYYMSMHYKRYISSGIDLGKKSLSKPAMAEKDFKYSDVYNLYNFKDLIYIKGDNLNEDSTVGSELAKIRANSLKDHDNGKFNINKEDAGFELLTSLPEYVISENNNVDYSKIFKCKNREDIDNYYVKNSYINNIIIDRYNVDLECFNNLREIDRNGYNYFKDSHTDIETLTHNNEFAKSIREKNINTFIKINIDKCANMLNSRSVTPHEAFFEAIELSKLAELSQSINLDYLYTNFDFVISACKKRITQLNRNVKNNEEGEVDTRRDMDKLDTIKTVVENIDTILDANPDIEGMLELIKLGNLM